MSKLVSSTGNASVEVTTDDQGRPIALVFTNKRKTGQVYWPVKDFGDLSDFVMNQIARSGGIRFLRPGRGAPQSVKSPEGEGSDAASENNNNKEKFHRSD